ncbi:hypothetical protein D3C75_158620 [compost metagenome]
MRGIYNTRGLKTVRKAVNNAPKGFDINMIEIMTEYELTLEQVKELGRLTAMRGGIAHATVGHNVYYRRRQIEDLFKVKPRTDIDKAQIEDVLRSMEEQKARLDAVNTEITVKEANDFFDNGFMADGQQA